MLIRLIEIAWPLKEQSAREELIRHGHISTLHIWQAGRPLAACRAVVLAAGALPFSLEKSGEQIHQPETFRGTVRPPPFAARRPILSGFVRFTMWPRK